MDTITSGARARPAVRLNADLFRARVGNIHRAALTVGLRPATISDLLTGKKSIAHAEVQTLLALAQLAGCAPTELLLEDAAADQPEESFAQTITRWSAAVQPGSLSLGKPQVAAPVSEADSTALLKRLPRTRIDGDGVVTPTGLFAV